jgi:ABC-type molybdate transport system ATPase subunit
MTLRKICLPPEKRRVGYVFQDARLFPHYNVRATALWHGEIHGRTV